MQDFEIAQIVRQIVREELAPILMGKVSATTSDFTASGKRFSGEPDLKKMRILSPYGVASRPKAGMESVIMPVAGDPTHLNVLTQNDTARPNYLQDGEVALYGPDGQAIYLKTGGEIHQGSPSASEPVVLGNVMKACIQALVSAFTDAANVGESAMGPVMLAPAVRSALVQALSTYVTTAGTNIVGQKNFVQRS